MSRLLNLFLVAAAALLSGCVTTGPTAGQQLDSLTQSISQRMAAIKAGMATGSEPVQITFSGSRIYTADDGHVQEVFALLPDVQPGSTQDYEAIGSLVTQIGSVIRANPALIGYVYVAPADTNSPLIAGYNSAIEQIAGRGRVTVKSDARLNVSRSVLVWVTGPEAAAQDALLSGEKRGLVVRPQIKQ